MYQAILKLKELQVYLEKVFQDEGSPALDVHLPVLRRGPSTALFLPLLGPRSHQGNLRESCQNSDRSIILELPPVKTKWRKFLGCLLNRGGKPRNPPAPRESPRGLKPQNPACFPSLTLLPQRQDCHDQFSFTMKQQSMNTGITKAFSGHGCDYTNYCRGGQMHRRSFGCK